PGRWGGTGSAWPRPSGSPTSAAGSGRPAPTPSPGRTRCTASSGPTRPRSSRATRSISAGSTTTTATRWRRPSPTAAGAAGWWPSTTGSSGPAARSAGSAARGWPKSTRPASCSASDLELRPMGADLDLYARRADGTKFPVEISLSPLHTEQGVLVSAAVRDVSERKQAQLQLAHQAVHDALTGLPNRVLVAERLD